MRPQHLLDSRHGEKLAHLSAGIGKDFKIPFDAVGAAALGSRVSNRQAVTPALAISPAR
jgi:hypothetical protein